MNTTIPVYTSREIELQMDMEVKSELESEDETINSSMSVTSSIEEVYKSEHAKSDEEEFEDEPLIEIESVMVPQELVKDEMEPNLLLFVKKDPDERDPGGYSVPSPVCSEIPVSAEEKTKVVKDDKCTQTDNGSELSITKVLRSVKTKQYNNFYKPSDQKLKTTKSKLKNMKNKLKKVKRKTLHCKSEIESTKSSPSNGCSFDVKQDSCAKLPKKNLKNIRKKLKISKKTFNRSVKRKNSKNLFNLSEEIQQVNKEGSIANALSLEMIVEDNYLSDLTEKETSYSVTELTGKENSPNRNENGKADCLFVSKLVLNDVRETENCGLPQEVAKPKSYDCTVCGKQFREKSHLATHARAHSDVRNFKCNECGLLFKTKTNLYFHMKTHDAPFTCSKCNKTFQLKKMFTRHMRVVHSGEGLYNCDICGRSFKSAHNLELHYTLHTGNKPFSCDVCHKSFVYKSTYQAHMKAHKADETFDCEVCLAAGACAGDRAELRRRCVHFSQARPWLCTVCGKSYPLKTTLKNHMKSHQPEKPFKCDECGKCFMKRQTYESHRKTHTGDKPEYMCDQCSQSYYSFVSLKRHYIKHTGEKNFVCDVCHKAFWTKDAMKVHRRSHENMKSFQCTQCSKAFAHKHSLVAHARSHSGEAMHACDVCCKTFLHKYHLTRHLRQHSAFPPPPVPLTPSLYMLPPHPHLDMPTLQIL